eukprot:12430865-Karenia_brevis.AAC.1
MLGLRQYESARPSADGQRLLMAASTLTEGDEGGEGEGEGGGGRRRIHFSQDFFGRLPACCLINSPMTVPSQCPPSALHSALHSALPVFQ